MPVSTQEPLVVAADPQGVRSALPVLLVRMFGWSMLAVLCGFLLNTYLTFWLGFPGADWGGLSAGGRFAPYSALQSGLYGALVLIALLSVGLSPHRLLRQEADRVSALNAYLVRAMVIAVILVGLVDAAVSFLRVEGLLESVVGSGLATDLGRSSFRGAHVHIPLIGLSFVLALFTRSLGFPWLALLVVVAELIIVIGRFVFSYEQAFMADLVRFWYAALFLFASAYTLLHEGHVRVDVFYAGFRKRQRGYVNAIGAVVLGMTLCWVILILGMGSRQSIITSPLLTYETSQSGFGLYVKYLMAGFLAVFAVTMLIQFVSYLFVAVADIRGEHDPVLHGSESTDHDGKPRGGGH